MSEARDLNRHEYAAREERATTMANYAHGNDITPEQLFTMPDEHWVELAFRAGLQNTDVSEETRKRVIQIAEGADKPVDPNFDPFEGL